MSIKKIAKKVLLRKKGIILDSISDINYDIDSRVDKIPTKIKNSHVHLNAIGNGCFIEHAYIYGNVEIGNHVSISGPATVLHAEKNKIIIGNFVSIASGSNIVEFNHKINYISTYAMNLNFFSHNFIDDIESKGDIIIEDDVWIGANSCILSGVKIGRGSIIGAGSVVTHNIPPYTIVCGNPAKELRKRFKDEEIKLIEETKWWTWSDTEIQNNKEVFLRKYATKK